MESLYDSQMKIGDLVILKDEEEIVWDDLMFEWDHTLLFSTREDARDMRITGGTHIPPGTLGTFLGGDSNFVRILTPEGVGWSRVHYWKPNESR